MIKQIKKIGLILGKADIFFYTLIWLMVLLVAGTIAQKYIGLYQAQNKYFSSFILWLGPVPLPGGMTTMGLMFLNLTFKLIFGSPWRWNYSGIIIAHLGAMLLLTGGMLTSFFSSEGSMLIYEGAHSDYVQDYHKRELAIFDSVYGEQIASIPFEKLKVGKVYGLAEIPFTIEIIKMCKNCEVFPREVKDSDPIAEELQGRAKKFDIKAIDLEVENERNRSGVMFRIKGAGIDDGVHFSVDFVDVSPNIRMGEDVYNIALRKKRTYLPFKIKLTNFEKKVHPGTQMASSFKSEIILIDGDSEWPSIVQMNEPLRYKGYTFYQSSYVDGETEATVFAVVKNAGRMFPYISSIVMCIGLLIHIFIKIPGLIRKKIQ